MKKYLEQCLVPSKCCVIPDLKINITHATYFSLTLSLLSLRGKTLVIVSLYLDSFLLWYKQHCIVIQRRKNHIHPYYSIKLSAPFSPSSHAVFDSSYTQTLRGYNHTTLLFYFLLIFYFNFISDLKKSCRNSTKNACVLVWAAITKYHSWEAYKQ